MRIGIIGAGKVGVTLGKYLADAGEEVLGFYSRTRESAAAAADFTQTTVYQNLEDLVRASDTLFLTTPDGEISKVWDCIAEYDLTDKSICHFSGSLSSNVFSGIERTGAHGISIHPMYAFSGKFTSYQQFYTAMLVMEGEETALQSMKSLFEDKLGHQVLIIQAADKVKYHAAAAMASNYMLALYETALALLTGCGFSREDSMSLLQPLIQNNVAAMLEKGPVESLTGPIERGDIETVQKHLESLSGSSAEVIYRELGQVLVALAKRKHQEWDDTAMRECLRR